MNLSRYDLFICFIYIDNVILNICSIKLYAFCHCERSEAVSWFARGLLRRKERSSQ